MRLWRSALKIGATYIGTVVGAGFASGQEILQFFTRHGAWGLAGVTVAGILFCWLGVKILLIANRLQSKSYHEFVTSVCGPWLGSILRFLITLFLFGGLAIMLAGTGAISAGYAGVSYNTGVLLTTGIAGITVLAGISGIVLANAIVVPLMVCFALGVSIFSLSYHGIALEKLLVPAQTHAPAWLLSAALYLAYNLILALTVLVPLGQSAHDRRTLIAGGWIGGVGLAVLAITMVTVTLLHYPVAEAQELPMLFITASQHDLSHGMYILVLWAEMFTTAIADLYGFAYTVTRVTGCSMSTAVMGTLILAFFCSQLGFARLLSILYPLFGYLSLIFVGMLLLIPQTRFSPR